MQLSTSIEKARNGERDCFKGARYLSYGMALHAAEPMV
jgi:hypothetical protein